MKSKNGLIKERKDGSFVLVFNSPEELTNFYCYSTDDEFFHYNQFINYRAGTFVNFHNDTIVLSGPRPAVVNNDNPWEVLELSMKDSKPFDEIAPVLMCCLSYKMAVQNEEWEIALSNLVLFAEELIRLDYKLPYWFEIAVKALDMKANSLYRKAA